MTALKTATLDAPPPTRSLRDFLDAVGGAPRRNFALCFLGLTLCTADQAFFSFAIPALVEEFDVALDVVGAVLSASFALAIVLVVVAGMLADRFGRVRVFALLLALSAVVVALHGYAESFSSLAVLRALSFALAAGLYPIANTIVLETAPDRYRGVLAGTLQISYPAGFFLGSVVAAHFLAVSGWRSVFFLAIAVVPVAFLMGRLMIEPSRPGGGPAAVPGRAQGRTAIAELFTRRWRKTVLACFAGSALTSIAIGGLTMFLPTFLVDSRGISASTAAQMAGMTFLIGIGGYVLSSWVGDFVLTRRDTLIVWVWLGAAFFAASLWLAASPVAVILVLGVTIMFLFGSEAVRMPLAAELFPSRLRATGSTLAGSAGVTFGLLVVPVVIGKLVAVLGWPWTYTLCGVLPLVVAGFSFLMLPNRRSARALDELTEPEPAEGEAAK